MRKDHIAHRLHSRESERFSRFDFRPVHGCEARKLDLRQVRAGVERHSDQHRRVGGQQDSPLGQSKEDEVDLYELWRIGEEAYIRIHWAAYPDAPIGLRHGSEEPDEHATAEREKGDLQRQPSAA